MEQLGLTQIEFAKVLLRAVGGWEQGARNGHAHTIPAPVALPVRFALKHRMAAATLAIGLS